MRPLVLASAVILATSAGAAAPSPTVHDAVEDRSDATAQQAGDMPVIDPDGPVGKACPPTSRYEAARRGGRLQAQRLDELPAADMYMAVYRHVGGCQAPIIAGYGFGAPSAGRR